MYPSFFAFGFSCLLLGVVVVILLYSLTTPRGISQMDGGQYNMLMLLLFLSIASGIHGLGHAHAEIYYGFNPMEGQWGYTLRK